MIAVGNNLACRKMVVASWARDCAPSPIKLISEDNSVSWPKVILRMRSAPSGPASVDATWRWLGSWRPIVSKSGRLTHNKGAESATSCICPVS